MTAAVSSAGRRGWPGGLVQLRSLSCRSMASARSHTAGSRSARVRAGQLFRHLVEHEGYRSIAIESDCVAGLMVDEFVAEGVRCH